MPRSWGLQERLRRSWATSLLFLRLRDALPRQLVMSFSSGHGGACQLHSVMP